MSDDEKVASYVPPRYLFVFLPLNITNFNLGQWLVLTIWHFCDFSMRKQPELTGFQSKKRCRFTHVVFPFRQFFVRNGRTPFWVRHFRQSHPHSLTFLHGYKALLLQRCKNTIYRFLSMESQKLTIFIYSYSTYSVRWYFALSPF